MFSGLPSGRPCVVRLSTSIPRDAIFIHVHGALYKEKAPQSRQKEMPLKVV